MKKISCENCSNFDYSTKFCRKLPPIPMIINKADKVSIVAKWPVIPFPNKDWCSEFKQKEESNEKELLLEKK